MTHRLNFWEIGWYCIPSSGSNPPKPPKNGVNRHLQAIPLLSLYGLIYVTWYSHASIAGYALYKKPTHILGNVRCLILLCCPVDRHGRKVDLNWKLKISNTTDNADITQSQARDSRHRRMQEANSLFTDNRPLRAEYCIVAFHTIRPSSLIIETHNAVKFQYFLYCEVFVQMIWIPGLYWESLRDQACMRSNIRFCSLLIWVHFSTLYCFCFELHVVRFDDVVTDKLNQ